MKQVVHDVFFDFSVTHEGFTSWPYADTLNLVTTGIGNKIDNGKTTFPGPNGQNPSPRECARLNNEVSATAMRPAMSLPWRKRAPGWTSRNPIAGDLISPAEIADAWTKVKQKNVGTDFSQQGGGAYAGLTDITLDMQGIKDLFYSTLTAFEMTIKKFVPSWEDFPADAQLGVMSMAWAMGPAFLPKFPGFTAALNRQDFASAGKQCQFKGGGDVNKPGTRNFENPIMFSNADKVQKEGVGFDQLFFSPTAHPTAPLGPSSVAKISAVNAALSNPFISTPLVLGGAFGIWKLWERYYKR